MMVSGPAKESAAFYRCDVCGRTGFWDSCGFSWSFFGQMEGDGLHFCSKECSESVESHEAAFKKMFLIEKDDFDCPWPLRKHHGLIGDKPKRAQRERAEDRFSPTESYGRVVCPACRHENQPPEYDALKVGGQIIACQGCRSSLHVSVEVLYLASVERVSREFTKRKPDPQSGVDT